MEVDKGNGLFEQLGMLMMVEMCFYVTYLGMVKNITMKWRDAILVAITECESVEEMQKKMKTAEESFEAINSSITSLVFEKDGKGILFSM